MSTSMQRLRRILLLLPAVVKAERQGRGLPLARAVEACGARSEAQLLEDIAAVGELWTDPSAGEGAIDLFVEDGEVGVTYAQDFGRPPAFSLAEGAMLLAALAQHERDGARPLKEVVRKLRKAIPELLRADADRLARGLDLGDGPPEPWSSSLQEAIDRRLETTVRYRSVADGEVRPRVVEPRLLFKRGDLWYLAAWSVAKGEEHLYRLDRIDQVVLGARVFGAHQGPPVSRYLQQGLFFRTGAEVEVSLRLTGLAAALAPQRFGAKASRRGGGAAEVRTRVTPGPFLASLVLGYGGEATVEGPPEQAAAVREAARRLLEVYSGSEEGAPTGGA